MELFIFTVFQLLMEVQSYRFPKVKVSPGVIRESSSVKISCEKEPGLIVNNCYFYINRKEEKMKTPSSCELDLTGAEVLRWAAVKSPESIDIYCYFTINQFSADISSSESDPITVRVLVSTSTTTKQTTTTAMKTSDLQSKTNPPNSTTKEVHSLVPKGVLFIVLASTAVAVILSGLMGLGICLCWFSRKKRRKLNKMRSIKPHAPIQESGISCSGPAETHSLITSVPETSQPISGGLKHQDRTADPTKDITSVNVLYQPSGPHMLVVNYLNSSALHYRRFDQ
ncbi:uncharacterized protein LOC122353695 isoform X2 [Puntigrus tetrazona]|uniref:uncharacterized protein LOC122353695 isoform X2 n=1 Tax=Puntigrus tetrazona TaxID=1606681 RepID=UPI001C8A3F68|nr:uncharacterized protein LOC122353695 isoform X2 [Puntigrus tetrazona]